MMKRAQQGPAPRRARAEGWGSGVIARFEDWFRLYRKGRPYREKE